MNRRHELRKKAVADQIFASLWRSCIVASLSMQHLLSVSFLLWLLVAVFASAKAVRSESRSEHRVAPPSPIQPLRILVLGGSGLVGAHFVRKALLRGHEVVAVSRRGVPDNWLSVSGASAEPRWISCDLSNTTDFFQQLSQEAKFDVYVHAAGVWFDGASGLSTINPWISGSGTVASNSSYDGAIRQSAYALIDLAIQQHSAQSPSSAPAVIFLSATEAGWTFQPPLNWLQRYLNAKRGVEHRLYSLRQTLRCIIFRPSFVWSRDRPLSLLTALPFVLGNYLAERILGVTNLINAPVLLPNLADAMLAAAEIDSEVGIRKGREIEELAERMKSRRQTTRVVVRRQAPLRGEQSCIQGPENQCLQEEVTSVETSNSA